MDLGKLDQSKAALDTCHHLRPGLLAALAAARFECFGRAARRYDFEGIGCLAVNGYKRGWIFGIIDAILFIVGVDYHGVEASFGLAGDSLRRLQRSWSSQLQCADGTSNLVVLALPGVVLLCLRGRKRKRDLLM